MQKISPLKTSLEAFKRFKVDRAKNIDLKNNSVATNPFGITFKGTVLQMDVFESASAKAPNKIIERMQEAGKLAASAWTGTINRISSVKENVIAFAGRIKNNTKDFIHMLNTTNVEFDFMKYNVSNLTRRPVSELGSMLEHQISLVKEV
ncbi:MAG: hypothetical protein E7Z91_04340 [Cyanobacteria bacterium SIG30]|nr:hypothetical protein [Cyanobacteria bacterium SIG30]